MKLEFTMNVIVENNTDLTEEEKETLKASNILRQKETTNSNCTVKGIDKEKLK